MAEPASREIGKRAHTAGTDVVDVELRLGRPESKYVKVSVEGAPYQRKVDLRAYGGYAELRAALLGLAGQMLDLAVARGLRGQGGRHHGRRRPPVGLVRLGLQKRQGYETIDDDDDKQLQ